MFCTISGEAPQEPVVSKLSGALFEKRLIEAYITEHGTEPVTGTPLTADDLLPLKSNVRIVRPRPPTLTSIPALLSTFQNEWDALALETFNLKEQLSRTREELATALYQHDAAIRVIARLSKERDEARDALSKVVVAGGGKAPAENGGAGEAMELDALTLPEELAEKVDEIHAQLSKSRKKRPTPADWATPGDVSSFKTISTSPLPSGDGALSFAVQGSYAAIASPSGDVSVWELGSETLERTLQAGESVAAVVWTGPKLVLGAQHSGAVKVFEAGALRASLQGNAGGVAALALHPGGEIVASVGGRDKTFLFYDLVGLKIVTRVVTEDVLTTCAFHPDGHLFAAGTDQGAMKLFMTKTGEDAASFSLPAPSAVRSLVFSENGFFFAVTASGAPGTVFVFDIRKEGAAALVKTMELGDDVGAVEGLAWDYSGQFLAAVGADGSVVVQQYNKGKKAWTEAFSEKEVLAGRHAVGLQWGEDAKSLVAVTKDGSVVVVGVEEAEGEEEK